jgi:uroporphyrinogen III methyltransferase / synthase
MGGRGRASGAAGRRVVTGPLAGQRVAITRAAEQTDSLRRMLEEAGATVVEIPTIAIVEPADGGEALRAALRELWDWVVVTSRNGVERTVAAAGGRAAAMALRWAVVGPGTAEALQPHGITPALVPATFVAEGLVEAFPVPPSDRTGHVLIAQAESARPVLADGLRQRGWEVTTVVAYRTVPVQLTAEQLTSARSCDAIAFTSASTVQSLVAAGGKAAVPAVVVAIGPVTATTASELGLEVTAVADPHTLEGLVAALIGARSA